MPEGPEVWILSEAINKFYHTEKTKAYGKHLFIFDSENKNICENWSFGLTGRVNISDDNNLTKLNTGWIYGYQLELNDFSLETQKLGTNWLSCSETELYKEINNWIKSKKKLASLILDQSKISGIGVAWGSEILFMSNLRPDMRACDQELNKLVESIIEIREKIKKKYSELIDELNCKEFINNWFDNLYKVREMKIYKKGTQIKVLGRTWWI